MGKRKGNLSHLKSGVKGKRWRKGQSSSSNPSTRKYREAAKNRFFNQQTGPSELTEAALAKHNEEGEGGDEHMSDITSQTDKLSITAKTFNSWATNWTECTNKSFGRVHRYWKSNSAFHKEILAILAAVTEIIKMQGGKESETEYLAALITALDTADNEQSLAAITYLISLVIKRVPVSVLRSRFSELAKKLLDYLGRYSDGESTSLLKSLLMSLGVLLRVQEQMVWSNPSTHQIYTALLTFVVHAKPKVRKAAHHAVNVVLKGSTFMTEGESPPHHPAASLTAKYCVQQIEECGGTGDAHATLHVLTLLRDVLGVFPQHSLKSACETVLRVMTLSNVMVTACGMHALHGMFVSQPKPKSLPAELTAQIITALYEYQPSVNDVQPMQAWLVVMEEAHARLGQLQEKLCVSHLPRLLNEIMSNLLSEKQEVREASAQTLKRLISRCLTPAADSLGSLMESSEVSQAPLLKIQAGLEKGLGYQYHASWGLVLQIFSVYYKTLGKQCWKIMTKSLESMAELRESHGFAYKADLDMAVGSAVKSMGPEKVLRIIPLNITGDSDNTSFPRSWLLPVLHDNIENTQLDFFVSYFLPLAVKLKEKVEGFVAAGHSIKAKSYNALQLQIWSLLPQFCIRPTDLSQSFPKLAQILGTALNRREDLRADILASLRKLILQSLNQEDNRAVLSRFSKNYLPILFNLYTMPTDQQGDLCKPAVLETIKLYLKITEPQKINSFLAKCLSQLEENSSRYNLLDLCIIMIPYADLSAHQTLYNLAKSQLDTVDRTLQKKCYRMLEEICSCTSADSQQFVKANLSELQEVLLSSLSSSGPASKAPRLKCLLHIIKHLEAGHEDFLMAVVPEAILCTKEIGERARLAAYNLLLEMSSTLTRWSSKPEEEILDDYFEMTMAGLAGTPHMISATLQAQARLIYYYKSKLSDRVLDSVIENSCVLLNAKQREVLQSCLALIKVVLASFTDIRLSCYLEKLVSSLFAMKEENIRHFRFKAKEIFARLIRKFGYETVSGMVPESYKKVLVNIRKAQERAKKKKKEKLPSEIEEQPLREPPERIEDMLHDTDSEIEQEEDQVKKKGSKLTKQQRQQKGGEAWLMEDNPSDIMDFLDLGTAKRVMASKPSSSNVKSDKGEGPFKMTSDGRLIITGDQDSEDGQSADEDDLQDLLDAFESNQKQKNRKRKLSMDDEEDDLTPTKYRPGGSGIHRPVGKGGKSAKKEGKPQKDPGLEYKAKKAGGDVKRKGQPDPYAYVPLQFSQLNKRKQAKLKGQFSSFVHGAKKGAAKGKKAKQKTRR